MKDVVCAFIYMLVYMYIVYMVNIRLKDLKFCRIQILKHQPQLQERRDNRSKSGGDDGWRVGSILQVGPYGRASPETVGHDVLKWDTVVKRQGRPRSPESVEAVTSM